MSRIGNQSIDIPSEVTVATDGQKILVHGPKGEHGVIIPSGISTKVEGNIVTVLRKGDNPRMRALHGLVRAEIQNAITGVTKQWTKSLELSGVGYRAALDGSTLVLTIGFSHPVKIAPPEGVTFAINEGKIVITGNDKQSVGQVAASVRAVKKPEPYKGKGIKYVGEKIRKKAGKAAKAIGGAPGAAAK